METCLITEKTLEFKKLFCMNDFFYKFKATCNNLKKLIVASTWLIYALSKWRQYLIDIVLVHCLTS